MGEIQEVRLSYQPSPISFEPDRIGLYYDPDRKQNSMGELGMPKKQTFEAEFSPPLTGDKSHYPEDVDLGGFFINPKGGMLWGAYEANGYYAAARENELLMIFMKDRLHLADNVAAALGTQPKKPLHVIIEESFKGQADDTHDINFTLAQVKLTFERYAQLMGIDLALTGL